MQNDRTITLIADDGKEVVCEILFTFKSEEYNHNYVIFKVPNEDTAGAAIYFPGENGKGTLEKIESEEEWEMVADAFDQYMESQQHRCGGNCGSCSGECCEGEECDCSE